MEGTYSPSRAKHTFADSGAGVAAIGHTAGRATRRAGGAGRTVHCGGITVPTVLGCGDAARRRGARRVCAGAAIVRGERGAEPDVGDSRVFGLALRAAFQRPVPVAHNGGILGRAVERARVTCVARRGVSPTGVLRNVAAGCSADVLCGVWGVARADPDVRGDI